MSRTATTPKFEMYWFPNEERDWAGKFYIDINLLPLMPDKNKTFTGSLVFDMRIWWRYVNTLYKVKYTGENISKITVEPPLTANFFCLDGWSINSFSLHNGNGHKRVSRQPKQPLDKGQLINYGRRKL